MTTWNPRYVAFAAHTGMTPEERHAADKAKRTGCMGDFIIWISQQWAEWGDPRSTSRSAEDHKNFDAWLAAKYLCHTQVELELC